jgi:hypothetical protein
MHSKATGRPKGSRTHLGEAFIADLYEHWKICVVAHLTEQEPVAFTDARHSGVGRKTVLALNAPACEVNASIRKFRIEAQARKEELRRYKRFGAEHGPLGGLCALVRRLFEIVQEARKAEPKKDLLRTFARGS